MKIQHVIHVQLVVNHAMAQILQIVCHVINLHPINICKLENAVKNVRVRTVMIKIYLNVDKLAII